MKVVHIITGLSTGGAEMALYRILSRRSSGYSHHVISLSTVGAVGRSIQELGVPVEALGMKPGVPNPLALVRLVRSLRRLQPDLVHTWMYHADFLGGVAAKLARVPRLAWAIRNSDLSADKTKGATRGVVKLCAFLSGHLPDRIISCSQTARNIHVALGYDDSRFVVIPNGFDLGAFCPSPAARLEVRRELGIPAAAPVIGLVARLDPVKNHRGFFEAAALLHARLPEVHFVLAGTGIDSENRQVAGWVRDAGIAGVTRLLGLHTEMARLTASFDIATSASWGEAFPNVVGEAMACGVPCVVTDVGDSAYIVGGTGVVIKPGDPQALADAWQHLLALSPEQRSDLGRSARARVVDNFDLKKIAAFYEALYEEMVMAKGSKS